ncbi:histone deacetylase [Nannocystis sp. SCPEA4]|uniref:histone deacetylase family protein n=1 Tax=Nannocystis sp. SCPEA4 TaxID=2996787 RepID=UPI002270C3C5|nr:histone deacetylase [Nannocystis sp. SCPEA4]MCY1057299.1 histone deacetylase [Nannocystis sp. SCPEA4]
MTTGDKIFRQLRRRANQMFARLRPPPLTFVYGPHYECSWPGSAVDEVRGERILTALAAEGLVTFEQVRRPPLATYHAIRRVHADAYLDACQRPEVMVDILGGLGVSEVDTARILDLQRAMTGGTMLATDIALGTGKIGVNLGGGFHHAHREVGRGFCVFHDVAVAIAEQRALGFHERVLVVDLDQHDGDGTRALFADDPTVFTLSIHNHHWGSTDAVASTSVALGDVVGDTLYLETVQLHLTEALRQHRPRLIYFLAGTDPAVGDKIGVWQISAEGMLERDIAVFEAIREFAPDAAVVVCLAGGYGPITWQHSARSFAWLQSGHRGFEPPDNDELSLMRARHYAALLKPADLTGEGDDLGLTLEDLVPSLAATAREPRFLGYYSRQGLELALERHNLLGRVRAKGFQPSLEFNLVDPQRHILKIFGDPDHRELLFELVVHRDRRTIPGFELLSVDWLLLQNPREQFTADKPQLPGQRHPGLGLFEEVVALLIIACERVGLAGLVVTPSQYHLAVQWQKRLRFVDPRAAARMRAIREAMPGASLVEAANALAAGRVVDHKTGETCSYEPAPMVFPISDELKAELDPENYLKAIDETADEFRFQLSSPR